MNLHSQKTKIVATIGPASSSREVLSKLLLAGMNVARINFSHGAFAEHKRVIDNIRTASRETGLRVAIMADLPGPKIRIGQLAEEPVELLPGNPFILSGDEIIGDIGRASVSFPGLIKALKPGNTVYLNDGMIQLRVVEIAGNEVRCTVVVGGELRSRKGLNLPGIDLGISAFTEDDRRCMKFALEEGVDAISQSFVQSAEDIIAVRKYASSLNRNPFIVAKIERMGALDQIDAILDATDGLMIARGDLGVEIPIERIALVQKELMLKANLAGKPVITATQMLESMVANKRPTRAESTDVANAVLDGTDCVMLSEESAIGRYPAESVAMLGKIAATVEPLRARFHQGYHAGTGTLAGEKESPAALIALSVDTAVKHASPAAVFVPTHSGASARRISRFRLPVWIVAVTSQEQACQQLQFSYGVHPECESFHPDNWKEFVRNWLATHEVQGDLVILTEGPSTKDPHVNNRMEIIDLRS